MESTQGDVLAERLYTEVELADLLRIKIATLRKQRTAGATPQGIAFIPHIRLGKKCIRYRASDVVEYLAKYTVSA